MATRNPGANGRGDSGATAPDDDLPTPPFGLVVAVVDGRGRLLHLEPTVASPVDSYDQALLMARLMAGTM